MARLIIRHETRYLYERPVGFGLHRLLLRPRDSHATRVVGASMSLSLPAAKRWVYDALGNCVCLMTPEVRSQELTIVSQLTIERFPAPLAPLRIDNPHTAMPIVYARGDRTILDPFIDPATDDPNGMLLDWVRAQAGGAYEPALDFLQRLNRYIHQHFDYRERDEEGTQTPAFTVTMGSGTCRDFAWLMVEALRRLGYAARFVTGYLYSPRHSSVRGAGATHAWCEVFLPDLGWMEFDPTNGLAESADLIPVAVSRTPEEATPISGMILGDPGRRELSIHVDVRAADTQIEPA
ncbi:transglutaminase family protein [Phenylobacterium sp.]|uniref:transglutaminase family protein n=1 Tax=Phenylobacterium sp. TaxID=1871053 RepID=UPI002715B97F|nr:transglutaminase family protein [Phenylobacterium sp.]MDO8799009.1 transglutaminase family protein [Phenylobacterium sp.]